MRRAESIGQRLRRERVAREMSLKDVAKLVEYHYAHLSNVEADRYGVSSKALRTFADLFDLDYGELLITARRVPEENLELMAYTPAEAIAYIRAWTPPSTD